MQNVTAEMQLKLLQMHVHTTKDNSIAHLLNDKTTLDAAHVCSGTCTWASAKPKPFVPPVMTHPREPAVAAVPCNQQVSNLSVSTWQTR